MRGRCVVMVLLAVAIGQSAVSAQVPRARARQELTLEGNMLGGYDDNLPSPTSGDPLVPQPPGYTGFGDGTLHYLIGTDARSMDVSGRAYMNTYRNAGVKPSYGGEQRLGARTTLGRRTRLEFVQTARYSPYFSLGLFGATQTNLGTEDTGRDPTEGLTAGSDNPDRNPTNAVLESRSWARDATVFLSRQWTRKTKMDLKYSLSQLSYVSAAAFDSRAHGGSLAFEQSISRTAAIHLEYRRADSRFSQQDGSVIPNLDQTAELGLNYQRRLSRNRQMSFSLGAGAMSVATVEQSTRAPARFLEPSGYANFRLDVGRSWNVGADYRRSSQVLQGITPQAFINDLGTINAGGWLQPWLETVFTAAYSNGVAGQRTPDRGPGRYDAYTGTVQLRFRLTNWWSSIVSADHYQYRLSSEASRSLGVSSNMHRNAVRVGFNVLMPLHGSSIKNAEPLRGPRN